jgi:lysine/ornithine N-monooxygenase
MSIAVVDKSPSSAASAIWPSSSSAGRTKTPNVVIGLGHKPIEPLAHPKALSFGTVMNLRGDASNERTSARPAVEVIGGAGRAADVTVALRDSCLFDDISKAADVILARHADAPRRILDAVVEGG